MEIVLRMGTTEARMVYTILYLIWGNHFDLTFFLSLSNSYLTGNKVIFVGIYEQWKLQTYQVYQSPVRVVPEARKAEDDEDLSAVAGAMICFGVLIGIAAVIVLFILIR